MSGIDDKQMSVLVGNGRNHIEALIKTSTPTDEQTAVLAEMMAAAHSVINNPVYPNSVKGEMMGNVLRAAFNYGRQSAQEKRSKKNKRPFRPKVRRK